MGKLTDEAALAYLSTFKTIYDNKKEICFISDNTNNGSMNYFRGFGDADTDEYIGELIYKEFGLFPSDALLKRVIKVIAYETKKNGMQQNVHYRVANTDSSIYVNMGDGSIIRITAKRVSIVEKSPVKFVLHNTLGSMTRPDFENGDIKLLRKYILGSDADFKLILVFIFNCFFTGTHYLLLYLMGPAGSAKSFITKVVKAVTDPSPVTLRNQFKNGEALVIAAEHCHLIDINNCSKLTDAIQDILCTMLTGGVATARSLYSNKGQSAIHTHNPVVMNGIESIITRDDLLERSLIIHLDKVCESDVAIVEEDQLVKEFNADLPRIMGGIFNALKDIMLVTQTFETDEKLSRMASFHRLGLVTEQALNWKARSFARAYKANLSCAQYETLESNKVAQALIKQKGLNDATFEGTYKELRDKLMVVGEIGQMEPRELRGILDRLSGSLSNLHGIKVKRLTRSGQGSRVSIIFK